MQAITAAANFRGNITELYALRYPRTLSNVRAGVLYWSQISKIVYVSVRPTAAVSYGYKLHPKTKKWSGNFRNEASALYAVLTKRV
jgi:hypothetical protein